MEQTDPRQLLINVIRILDGLKIPYLVTGGMAVFVWGRPRFTADIDIVVELPPAKAAMLGKALHALGEAGYLDEDAMHEAMARRGEFNFVDGTTGVKVDFWVSEDSPFDRSRFRRRQNINLLGEHIAFTSAEDLILVKLRWDKESYGSSKQFEDVISILSISGKKLDQAYLNDWAHRLDVEERLDEAKLSASRI